MKRLLPSQIYDFESIGAAVSGFFLSLRAKPEKHEKNFRLMLAAFAAVAGYGAVSACTNFIVTKGASTDGSVMVTYAADSHALYGALYHTPGGRHKDGAMLPVYEWDTGRYLCDIPQAPAKPTPPWAT